MMHIDTTWVVACPRCHGVCNVTLKQIKDYCFTHWCGKCNLDFEQFKFIGADLKQTAKKWSLDELMEELEPKNTEDKNVTREAEIWSIPVPFKGEEHLIEFYTGTTISCGSSDKRKKILGSDQIRTKTIAQFAPFCAECNSPLQCTAELKWAINVFIDYCNSTYDTSNNSNLKSALELLKAFFIGGSPIPDPIYLATQEEVTKKHKNIKAKILDWCEKNALCFEWQEDGSYRYQGIANENDRKEERNLLSKKSVVVTERHLKDFLNEL